MNIFMFILGVILGANISFVLYAIILSNKNYKEEE